eukprot:COSAG02_NODE_3_length_74588_cov_108.368430_29_plen_106_part_00
MEDCGSRQRRSSSTAVDRKHSRRRKSVSEGLIESEHSTDTHHGHRRRRKSVDKPKSSNPIGEDGSCVQSDGVALPGQLPLSPAEATGDDDGVEDRDTSHNLKEVT